MDIVSHGLWGSLAFGRKSKKDFLWAFVISMLPDLFSFGVLFVDRIFDISGGGGWEDRLHSMDGVPLYVHHLYNTTHSLVVFAVVFGIVWAVRRKPFIPLMAWGLHILVDIPSHSFDFFPTPMLWPLWDYKFNGISWGNPLIYYPNLFFLAVGYLMYYFANRRQTNMAKKVK